MFRTASGHQLADESRFSTSCGIATVPASGPVHPSGIVLGINVLKARGLTAASELSHGLWGAPAAPPTEGSRTV